MNKYKIHVLIGQRKGSYPEQYAPEVLAAMDELGDIENPEYLIEEHEKYRSSNEFDALAKMVVAIPYGAISKALYPRNEVDGEATE